MTTTDTMSDSSLSDANVNVKSAENGNGKKKWSMLVWINIGIIGLLLLLKTIDAYCFRIHDYVDFQSIFYALFGFSDVLSDVLFSKKLTDLYLEQRASHLLGAMMASYAFIVLPITVSLYQLSKENEQSWKEHDHLKRWMKSNALFLFLLSIFTGSSFVAVYIVNCDLCQLGVFTMGLSRKQKRKFRTKRIWGVVLFEVMSIYIMNMYIVQNAYISRMCLRASSKCGI